MVLMGQFSEGLLYVVLSGAFLDAEDFVVVFGHLIGIDYNGFLIINHT
jgi:hypothetical protein